MNKFIVIALVLVAQLVAKFTYAQGIEIYSDEQLKVVQRSISNSYPGLVISDDPVIANYITNLSNTLQPKKRIYTAIALENNLNAFATLGNVIVFNSSLIIFTESESELIGVLAHEHAHIEYEHFDRMLHASKVAQKIGVASVLLAILINSSATSEVLIANSSIQKSLEYDVIRQYEREADQQVVTSLNKAGYDLDGFISLLERMEDQKAYELPEYLSTHPVTSNRIADIRLLVENKSQNNISKKEIKTEDLSYFLVREKLRFLTADKRSITVPEKYIELIDAYTGLLNNEELNDSELNLLSAHVSNEVVAYELAGYLAISNKFDQAQQILIKASKLHPDNLSLKAQLLNSYAIAKMRPDAIKLLAKLSFAKRNSPAIINAETKLWYELEDTYSYQVAVGYRHFVNGNLPAAKKQIKRIKASSEIIIRQSAVRRLEQLEHEIIKLEALLDS